jgi:hypothetical protein
MSDTSSLTDLARFVGQSTATIADTPARQRGGNGLAAGVKPKPQRHSVADLLGVVLVLSARTRRVVLPRVAIELDVFGPAGNRAVRILLPRA